MTSISPTDHRALLDNAAWVKRLARRLVSDEQTAEDVAQDTLAAAIENPPHFYGDVPRLRRWLSGVVRNLVARAWSRERDRSARESRYASAEDGRGEDDANRRLDLHQVLVAAVQGLSEPYRSTIVSRYFDELTTREIAAQQGVPQATVRKRLSRATDLLRVRLDGEFGGGRHGWCVALIGMLETGNGAAPAATFVKAVPTLIALGSLILVATGWHAFRRGDGHRTPATLQAPHVDAGALAELDVAASSTIREDHRRIVAPPVEAASLDILVVDASGTPSPDALVVRLGERVEFARAVTNAAGRVSFPGLGAAGHLVAQSADGPPTLLSLAELTGRHEVVVREGTTLSGWLTEDGDPPREPVAITLVTFEDTFEALDEELRERLADAGVRLGRREQETSEDGSFGFHGLPADWSGSLQLPTTHRFLEAPRAAQLGWEGRSATLRSPSTGLALRTMRLPPARGRVLDAATRKPIAGASLAIWASFGEHDQTPLITMLTDAQGRFLLGLCPGGSSRRIAWRDPAQRRPLERLSVTVDGVDDCLGIERQFDPVEIGPDGDLGDLLLPRGRSLHLRVVDTAGEPIPGAIVSPRPMSSPTDSDGRTRLRGVPPERESVFVGSPVHRIRDVPIGSRGVAPDDPLEVVLEPGNRLEISVICEPREAVEEMRVRLAGSGRLYEIGKPGWGTHLHAELGSGRMSVSSSSDEWEYTDYTLDAEGRLTLLHLAPGVEMEVTVRVGELELARTRLRGPGPGETVRQELVVERRPLTVDVAVVDATGHPVPRASVRLDGIDAGGLARTDVSGLARFERVWAAEGPASLTVRCDGYAARRVGELVIEHESSLPTVVLERGRNLHVEIVDELGVPLDVDLVRALAEGFPGARAELRVGGGFELTDLPEGPLALEITYAHRTFSRTHSARESFTKLVLPVHGALECSMSPGARRTDDEWYVLHLRALDDAEVDITARLYDSNGRAAWRSALLPARYGLQLVSVRRTGDGLTESPVGLEEVVDIRPGETTRVTLGE